MPTEAVEEIEKARTEPSQLVGKKGLEIADLAP